MASPDDRAEVEAALRHVEECLKALLAPLPSLTLAVDQEGRILLVEGQGLGKDAPGAHAEGRPATEVFALIPWFAAELQRALAGERFEGGGHVDGRWFSTRYLPLASGGAFVYAVEAPALPTPSAAASARRPAFVAVVDRQGVVLAAEGRLLEAVPVDTAPADRVGRSAFDLHHEDPLFLSHLERALRGAPSTTTRLSDSRWIEARFSPLRRGEEVMGAAIVVADVTAAVNVARDALAEHRYRLVLEQVPAVVWTTDHELRVTSAAGAALQGIPRLHTAELGMTISELFQTADPAHPALDGHRRALRGEKVEYATRFHGHDFASRVEPYRDATGKVVGCIGVAFDVTERLRTESELERSLSLLHSTLESTMDGLLVVDTSGRIVRFNRKFVEIWRVPADVLATGDDERVLAAVIDQVADPEAFKRRVDEIYADPALETSDVVEFKDGRVIERYSRAQWIGEEPVGRVWSFRDVTGRVRAERDRQRLLLAEREARTEAERARRRSEFLDEASRILAASLDYEVTLRAVARLALPTLADYCIIDVREPDGRLRRLAVEHRDPAKASLARELERLAPDPTAPIGVAHLFRTGEPEIHSFIDDAKLDPARGYPVVGSRDPRFLALFRRIGIRSRMNVPLVARGRTLGALSFVSESDPQRFGPRELELAQALASRAALAVDNARLYGDAKSAEREARAAVRMREEFLSIASHELRTPLTGIQLAVQTLLRLARTGAFAAEQASAVQSALSVAERQTRHFVRLVENLLDVSRLVSGKLPYEPEELDLVALAREAIAQFSQELSRSGSRVVLHGVDRCVGRWDRTGVERVLANLLSNAIKYGSGRPIEVGIQPEREVVRVTVRDHGIGIRPEVQRELFGRFVRGVSGRAYGGLGLGLYIVRGILEAHGGRIVVESVPAKGSTFTVVLPLAPAVSVPARRAA